MEGEGREIHIYAKEGEAIIRRMEGVHREYRVRRGLCYTVKTCTLWG